MKEIPSKSLDMILCDLPYGVTQNPCDKKLPYEDEPEGYVAKISDMLELTENGKLYGIIDVAVVTLPINERQRLENGIKISSEKELYSLIEDYTG